MTLTDLPEESDHDHDRVRRGALVSFRGRQLAFIDVATGSVTFVDTGFSDVPVYFYASDGHRLVIRPWRPARQVSADGGVVTESRAQLAVADLDMRSMTATTLIDRSSPSLGTIVDRYGHEELWFLRDDAANTSIDRLDLVTGAYETISLGFHPVAVGYLPMRDLFVFSEASPPSVRFWQPGTRTTLREVAY